MRDERKINLCANTEIMERYLLEQLNIKKQLLESGTPHMGGNDRLGALTRDASLHIVEEHIQYTITRIFELT